MISVFAFKRSGRNNTGRITVRHRGAGVKFFYPNCSYKKSISKEFNVSTLRVGLNQTINLFVSPALPTLTLPRQHKAYAMFNVHFSKNPSNSVKYLFEFSIGQFLSDIEIIPGSGPVFSRAPGTRSQLLKKRGTFATLRLSSGEIRRISVFCFARPWSPAITGKVANVLNPVLSSFVNKRKAGFNRLLGIRPHVRGCAINPVDHPHGGRTGESRPSVSPWAQLTKGYRTRFKPVNKRFVLFSVQNIKDKDRQVVRK